MNTRPFGRPIAVALFIPGLNGRVLIPPLDELMNGRPNGHAFAPPPLPKRLVSAVSSPIAWMVQRPVKRARR